MPLLKVNAPIGKRESRACTTFKNAVFSFMVVMVVMVMVMIMVMIMVMVMIMAVGMGNFVTLCIGMAVTLTFCIAGEFLKHLACLKAEL